MVRADHRPRVLFLCTGNSCRSQMAEGWARALLGDRIDTVSAGTQPQGLNPLAVRVMGEVGIDLSTRHSKHIAAVSAQPFDLVATVCDNAREACPTLPGRRTVHRSFDDPPALARDLTNQDAVLAVYRRVRDEIRVWVLDLGAQLSGELHMSTPTNGSCCSPSCCGGEKNATAGAVAVAHAHAAVDAEAVRETVRTGYGEIARSGSTCCGGSASTGATSGGCCGPQTFTPDQLAAAIGYSAGDLAATPDSANMGLSCGNPTAIASLKPGEVVLDLGSGGGFDCFVAGPKVGASGRVIGVDMTPDMLAKARRNIATYRERSGIDNVEFRLGEIEALPVADAGVDVVISNCVLNLSPDKPRVWREIARVLKPGGRVAVSDLALIKPLPESVRQDVEALVGCIAGAVLVEETHRMAEAAGLRDVALTSKPQYIEAMTDWQDPLYRRIIEALPKGSKPSDYITSLDIVARKP